MSDLCFANVFNNRKYRIIALPAGVNPDKFPDIGSVGICIMCSHLHGVNLDFGGNIVTEIPYKCLQRAQDSWTNSPKMEDALLLTLILEHPDKVLRLLKGLAKMTGHHFVKNFVERGELPFANYTNR